MNIRPTLLLFFLSVSLTAAACESEFESYNDVKGLRILAMGSDKPHVPPGETATLSALVNDATSYSWSWCPFAGGSETGYECAVSHQEVQAFADELLAEPVVIPAYDLGSGETAAFVHDVPPLFYRTICEFLLGGSIPDGFDVPDCTESFTIQISLTVQVGNRTLKGISDLSLLLDAATVPNLNPVLDGITISQGGGAEVELAAGAPTQMSRGVLYELKLDVSEDSAEPYIEGPEQEEARENLTATWFHQGGELDKDFSSFLPGSIPIDVLQRNQWTPPSEDEYPDGSASLSFVLRDSRNGITWQTREIELVSP